YMSLFNRHRSLLCAGRGLLLRAAALFRELALRFYAAGLIRRRAFALLLQPLLLDLLLGPFLPLAGQETLPLGAPFGLRPGLFCGQPVAFLFLPPRRFQFRVRFSLPLFLFKGL